MVPINSFISPNFTAPEEFNFLSDSLTPPLSHPITDVPHAAASIIVLPNGSGLFDRLNTNADNLYKFSISGLASRNLIF